VTKEQFEDIFQNFKKAFIERALNAEMSHHLGYGAGQAKPASAHRGLTASCHSSPSARELGWRFSTA
jgi:transposase-like protein